MTLGFVGTGVISAAVIEGICKAWANRYAIHVSPRSEATSRALAERHANVQRAATNEEVVEASEVVFLGMRPQQMREVVASLPFRDGQIVVSFIAGASVEALQALIPAKVRLCRVTPLPMIAELKGPVVLQPRIDEIHELLTPLGTLIEVESAEDMATLGIGSGLMSGFFTLALEAVDQLAEEGIPRDVGRKYIFSMFAALSETGLSAPVSDLALLPEQHETEGGINEACRERLAELGWFAQFREGMEAIKARSESLAG